VIETLREEKSISEIASREGINPNQIGNWKREFLENASIVFDMSTENWTDLVFPVNIYNLYKYR
jgi:putative transposase